VALGLATGLAGPAATAAGGLQAYVVDPARSRVGFHATSRLMDAEGRFGRVAGELQVDLERPESAAGHVTVEVASLDTGIRRRDDHLRSADFLDAARHPRGTFVVASARREGPRWLVAGDLTIRGVTRPVAVVTRVEPDGPGVRVTGELTVSRRAFGIAYDSVLNPVRDPVRVTFELVAQPR
jgi:polyisoprenoid-binding protein YceI